MAAPTRPPEGRADAEAAALLKTLIHGSPAGIAFVDRECRFRHINERLAEINGYPPEHHLGKTVAEVIPQLWPSLEPLYRRVLDGGESVTDVEMSGEVASSPGVRRDWIAGFYPVRGGAGEVLGVGVMVVEVTERKQAEGRLRAVTDELRARLRQQEAVASLGHLAVSSPDPDEVMRQAVEVVAGVLDCELCEVLELRGDGGSLLLRAGVGWRAGLVGQATVSAGPETQAGYTLRSDGPVIVDDFRGEARFSGPELLREHGVVSGLSVVIRGRGRPYGVLGAHSTRQRAFSRDDVNFLQAVANILADAVERKRLEDRSRQETALTERMMEALPGLVCLFDEQPRFVKWNEALERVTGYTGEELARLPPLDLIVPGDREAVADAIRAAFQTGYSSLEAVLLTRSGEVIPYLLSGVRIVTEQGPRLLGVGLDITERKRLEEQYRQAQKMEALGLLAGGVAHDFNNLLTIINGYSDLLLQRLAPGDPLRDLVSEIYLAGERAGTLTRQLLAFSRQQVIEPRVLDLNAAVRDTEKLLRRLIGEDVILTTDLDPALGPVKLDPGQLEQVLINLAVNARDAMPRGGRLTLRTRNATLKEPDGGHAEVPPGSYSVLEVADTGTGMDEATRAHIFEPFFTTKGPGKGTGLGLATVHGIVKQSGGHVQVSSAPGRGTTFTLYLPQARGAPASRRSQFGGHDLPRDRETLLVVEDEDALRSLSRHILRGCGYTVLEARDGTEALEIARSGEKIDLLVSDVVMPHLGGRILAERITNLRPGCKVLFLSGYTDDTVVRHGVQEAEFAFLQKPYTPALLAQKVREVLDG